MPKIIEAVYENGVFKPLEKVDLREGERVKLRVEKDRKEILKNYRGLFGKSTVKELQTLEWEAFM
uniref:Antitoxin n=1 Tax=Geoglobus ahangari TaxID=113653 RepID=A0A7C3UBC8_9EURY